MQQEGSPITGTEVPVKQVSSPQFTLNWRDVGKGALMAVLTAVLTTVLEIIQKDGLAGIKWETVGTVGLTAFIGYLLKNWLLEPSKTITIYKKA